MTIIIPRHVERTNEITQMLNKKKLKFVKHSENKKNLKDCDIYIVTVPTPIDMHKKPDLSPLKNATEAVGSIIQKGDIVIFESTVFPGATEEVCVPILESQSDQ